MQQNRRMIDSGFDAQRRRMSAGSMRGRVCVAGCLPRLGASPARESAGSAPAWCVMSSNGAISTEESGWRKARDLQYQVHAGPAPDAEHKKMERILNEAIR
ncbi:hypothetical protein [Burkholderia gladioli]|uniref:hypothetical protein n=1 Tax=Burkholderia gladioli TaxID=28095 RepID=UPI001641B4CF|nr:hypothetical protein [Burkholderia gladioli]